MQTSSVDHGKGITKAELLKILRGRFTSRQLTELCGEGLLPPLQRRPRPGSNKPVYVWDESVVEQAKFLYDLLQWDRAPRWVVLPLWLRGHAVDFAPIRQRWLQSIDAYLQAFTQGNEEESYPGDGPEDHISRVIDRLKERWKHTPTRLRPEPLRRLGLEAYAQWTELFWDVLLVADYEADETTFAEVLAVTNAAGNDAQLQEEFTEGFLSWVQTLQEILAIPRLREVIEQAMPEAWERARLDYMTLCQFFTFFALLTQGHPEGMYLWLFAASAWRLTICQIDLRESGSADFYVFCFSSRRNGPLIESNDVTYFVRSCLFILSALNVAIKSISVSVGRPNVSPTSRISVFHSDAGDSSISIIAPSLLSSGIFTSLLAMMGR